MSVPVATKQLNFDDYTSGEKALAVVATIGGIGAVVGVTALIGSIAGVGAMAGIIWNVTGSISGSIAGGVTHKLSPVVASIVGLAAIIFGGALGLMAYKGLALSVAAGLSVKMLLIGTALVLGTGAALGITALIIGGIAGACMSKRTTI